MPAGGERLLFSSLTYSRNREANPQFVPLWSATLLEETTCQVRLPGSRGIGTNTSIKSVLAGVSPETVLVQPSDRGTAAVMPPAAVVQRYGTVTYWRECWKPASRAKAGPDQRLFFAWCIASQLGFVNALPFALDGGTVVAGGIFPVRTINRRP